MPGGGPHPQDRALFAGERLEALRRGAEDLRLLRERGYALPGALKLVGDRYQLRERQRTAITRATSIAEGAAARRSRRVPRGAPAPEALWIDGFNVLITIETALNGGVLVTTLDAGLRDLAGVHGSYRLSEATDRAIALAAQALEDRGWSQAATRWLLDRPVSNTGRLAARLRASAASSGLPWSVEVVGDPDAVLVEAGEHVSASSDAAVLEGSGAWIDLGAEAVRAYVPEAWIVDLFSSA